LIADVVRTTNQVQGEEKYFDFGGVLITRFKPGDANHQKHAGYIRSFLSDVFTNAMAQTIVLEKLGPRLLTLYEVDQSDEEEKYAGDKRAFERALESMNDVNREIAGIIQSVWHRGELPAAAPSPFPFRVVSDGTRV
jgi:chromosome partitioning protein